MPRKSLPVEGTDAPSVDDVAAALMRWSALAMQAARADGMPQMLRLLNEHNLSMPMVVVLHLLAFEGTQTMTSLSERTGLSTSATSHLIQRLVEARLVDRREGVVDRRVREIALTASGQALTAEMLRQRFADLRASVAPLSSTTRARLAAAVTDVAIELAAALGAAVPGCPGVDDPVASRAASKGSMSEQKGVQAQRRPVPAADVGSDRSGARQGLHKKRQSKERS